MKYANGQEARLGDKIIVGEREGRIVCSLDTDEFTHAFTKEKWGFLRYGVLALMKDMGVVHYNKAAADMQLVEREPAA